MTLSNVTTFICIFGCLSIISLDCRWLISMTAYAQDIAEDCSVCGIGIKYDGVMGHAVGSSPENEVSYPWMVSLGYSNPDQFCLGTIIDAFHILTAAHCVTNDKRDRRIYHNVHFRNLPVHLYFGYKIDKVIIHPRFRLIRSESAGVTIAEYDIAIVKLKDGIKCDKYRNPISLPPADFKLPLGAKSIYTGWSSPVPGYTVFANPLHNDFIENLKFRRCVKGVPEARKIKNHMLCQGGTEHYLCYGDSGGPLMNKINETYYIVGIASSETNRNCSLHMPMTYTNVFKFLNWIQKNKETTFSFPRDNTDIPLIQDANETKQET